VLSKSLIMSVAVVLLVLDVLTRFCDERAGTWRPSVEENAFPLRSCLRVPLSHALLESG